MKVNCNKQMIEDYRRNYNKSKDDIEAKEYNNRY